MTNTGGTVVEITGISAGWGSYGNVTPAPPWLLAQGAITTVTCEAVWDIRGTAVVVTADCGSADGVWPVWPA